MADADTEKLKKILMESYRNKAKDKRIKDAIRKRIADKKLVKKKGKGAVSKETAHNLKYSTLSEEAEGAIKKTHTGAGSDKVEKAKAKKKKKKEEKKDVFSVGLAVENVKKIKDRQESY